MRRRRKGPKPKLAKKKLKLQEMISNLRKLALLSQKTFRHETGKFFESTDRKLRKKREKKEKKKEKKEKKREKKEKKVKKDRQSKKMTGVSRLARKIRSVIPSRCNADVLS
jgi:hypothetical protein